MNNLEIDKEQSLVVRESVLLNSMIGTIFLAILVGVLFTRNFEINQTISSFHIIYIFLILTSTVFFVKAKRHEIILSINRNGIFYRNRLVTDWNNFINAYINQEEYVVSNNSDGLNDKFYIIVTFFEPTAGTKHIYKMAMSGSQNKSEYQVISAIEYFSKKNLSREVV